MGKNLKRGVATITCYVYGETDEELKENANELCTLFQDENDANVEKLHLVEFGKIGEAKEIKLDL